MRTLLHRFVGLVSKGAGSWVFVAYAWIVSTGFFLFFPLRVRESARFYRILFPDRCWPFHLWCAWRQFHNFAGVFIDRFLLQEHAGITHTAEGWEHLERARRGGRGAILLMSHMGNWEVAAHLLRRRDDGLRLLLYMGSKHKEQLERIQKESLCRSGIEIIAVDRGGGSPLDIVEGVRFLASGGLVSMTGDLVWKEEQRTATVRFLGRETRFPATPHLLALLSGAPLLVFFAFRTGKGRYRFSISEPIPVRAPSRAERADAVQRSAQRYAAILEETLRRNPLQWYHFEPFFGAGPRGNDE